MVQETGRDEPATEDGPHEVEVAHADSTVEAVMNTGDVGDGHDNPTTAAEAAMAVESANAPDGVESVTVTNNEVARRRKIIADAPYHAEGFNVYDGRGRRIVICGTDDNRAASGPGLACSIAEVFNRIAGGH